MIPNPLLNSAHLLLTYDAVSHDPMHDAVELLNLLSCSVKIIPILGQVLANPQEVFLFFGINHSVR